jgi:HK97 family phage prohead protease
VSFCLSDGSVDRMGDTIAADGWVLDGYRQNPVVLWAHDALSPPIGRMHNLRVAAGRLLGDVEFADAELSPFADEIFGLIKGGFIRAGSVGFLPLDYAFSRDPSRSYGIDFKRQELLEFSVVPVPANANALVQASAAASRSRLASTHGLGRSRAPSPRQQIEPLEIVAGCAIDRERERHKAEAREDLRRRRRLLRLAFAQESWRPRGWSEFRSPTQLERQHAYVAELGRLLAAEDRWA